MDRYFRQQPEPVCDAVASGQAGDLPHDDATTAYVLETRKAFEDLRQVASQLAGLLVLAAAGSSSAGPHHPMLTAAERLFQEACEGIRTARVTLRAQRHHDSLLRAAAELRTALDAAHGQTAVDPVLAPVRAAYRHLQAASRELPGFSMVAFGQGCCGGGHE